MALGPDRRYMTRTQAEAAAVDVGLRSYMLRVYNYMALGVAFTGAISLFVASNPALVQTIGSLFWVLFIALLGLGWFAPKLMLSRSVATAQAVFWSYAGLWGLLLGPVLWVYGQIDPMLVVRAFFITAAAFGGLSLVGYTTKKDLSPMGAFLAMATIGLLVAILVNVFFVQSSGFSLLLSMGVVLVFSGLTAYETQQIKNWYVEHDSSDVATQKSIFGAFMLYGSFVVLFVHILNILGIMRE